MISLLLVIQATLAFGQSNEGVSGKVRQAGLGRRKGAGVWQAHRRDHQVQRVPCGQEKKRPKCLRHGPGHALGSEKRQDKQ